MTDHDARFTLLKLLKNLGMQYEEVVVFIWDTSNEKEFAIVQSTGEVTWLR